MRNHEKDNIVRPARRRRGKGGAGASRPALDEGPLAELLRAADDSVGSSPGTSRPVSDAAKAGYDAAVMGRRLQEIRQAAGLTQLQVGAQLGLTQSRISQIEAGDLAAETGLSVATATAFADACGFTLAWDLIPKLGVARSDSCFQREVSPDQVDTTRAAVVRPLFRKDSGEESAPTAAAARHCLPEVAKAEPSGVVGVRCFIRPGSKQLVKLGSLWGAHHWPRVSYDEHFSGRDIARLQRAQFARHFFGHLLFSIARSRAEELEVVDAHQVDIDQAAQPPFSLADGAMAVDCQFRADLLSRFVR